MSAAYAFKSKALDHRIVLDPNDGIGLIEGAEVLAIVRGRRVTGRVKNLTCRFLIEMPGGTLSTLVDTAQPGIAVTRVVELK